jgi:hypothetical protein
MNTWLTRRTYPEHGKKGRFYSVQVDEKTKILCKDGYYGPLTDTELAVRTPPPPPNTPQTHSYTPEYIAEIAYSCVVLSLKGI